MSNKLISLQDLINVTGGVVQGSTDRIDDFLHIIIDTRTIKESSIFVALKGSRSDGHDFVHDAFQKGAILCIVERPIETDRPLLIVSDAKDALTAIAKFIRTSYQGKVIAITGSVGKTTLKENTRSLLQHIGKTHANFGNFNNSLGVSISLSNLPHNADYGVFEVGMNAAGEIKPLSHLIKPDIACITEIGPAHIGNFASLTDIAYAKAEIFEGLSPNGFAIFNGDNNFKSLLTTCAKEKNIQNILTFGLQSHNDIHVISSEKTEFGLKVDIMTPQKPFSYYLPFYETHWIYISLAAFSILYALDLEMDNMLAHFKTFTALSGRGEISKVECQDGSITLIDETYNANPLSMQAAFEKFNNIDHSGRKIFMIGDMFELGDQSQALHLSLQEKLLQLKADLIIFCGQHMYDLYQHLHSNHETLYFEKTDDIILWLKNHHPLHPHDLIMIKGSRIMEMDKIITYLHSHNVIKPKKAPHVI